MLVIPDAHAHPAYDNKRFTALGRFADKLNADYEVCLGDWGDYPGYSTHDPLGSKPMEAANYADDHKAAVDALDLYEEAAGRLRTARKTVTLGNHCVRPQRAAAGDTRLEGTVPDLGDEFRRHGWRVVGYRDTVTIEGILFSHHLPSGVTGRPIGGENVAATLIRKNFSSCIVGHGHVLDYAERTRQSDGKRLLGISAGCYVHPKYGKDSHPTSAWCRDTVDKWWRGVVVLRDLDGYGYAGSIEFVGQHRILREFG